MGLKKYEVAYYAGTHHHNTHHNPEHLRIRKVVVLTSSPEASIVYVYKHRDDVYEIKSVEEVPDTRRKCPSCSQYIS